MRFTLVVVVIAACHKAAPPPVDCTRAGDGVSAFWSGKVASAPNESERGYAQTMLELAPARLVRHCKADGWSAAVVECAKTDSERCIALLTPEQREQLRSDPEAQMITRYEPLQALPDASPPAITCQLEPLAIEIAPDGVWLGVTSAKASCVRARLGGAIDRAALETELRRVAEHAAGCAVPIEITATGHVAYQEVISVIDVAVKAGLPDCQLAMPSDTAIAKPATGATCPLPGGRHDIVPASRPIAEAGGTADVKKAPVVVITTNAIEVAGKQVATIADARRPGRIAALARALPDHPADGTIIVQADRDTESVVILHVVDTVKGAGYDNVLFAVARD